MQVVDRRPVRKDLTPLDQQIGCDLIGSDPDMVDTKNIDLVDRAKLVRPLLETFITVSAWNVPDTADEGQTWTSSSNTSVKVMDQGSVFKFIKPFGPGNHRVVDGRLRNDTVSLTAASSRTKRNKGGIMVSGRCLRRKGDCALIKLNNSWCLTMLYHNISPIGDAKLFHGKTITMSFIEG